MPTPFADFAPPISPPTPLRAAITAAYRRSEPDCVASLVEQATLPDAVRDAARATATKLITALRAKHKGTGVEGLVQEYSLSSQEGVALMCLAEALLRIPDNATRDALIRDKISPKATGSRISAAAARCSSMPPPGASSSRASSPPPSMIAASAALTRLIARAGEPVIRRGVDMAMRMMGEQFVTGETIDEALKRAPPVGGASGFQLFLRHAGRGGDDRPRMPSAIIAITKTPSTPSARHRPAAASMKAPAFRSSSLRCTRAMPAPRRSA
jgi:RHH-type proline utilization regulon transcriptional repressor/proline dehydrogenase/delta 1-pyrroline-5-carboxylate dehydrogenase